jgi:hypothetical protein
LGGDKTRETRIQGDKEDNTKGKWSFQEFFVMLVT